MQRSLYFCKSWFAAKKIPIEVWTEAQAKAAHKVGRNYTVLADSLERPFCNLTVTPKAVFVDFLDEHLRAALSYQFQEMSAEHYFLTMAVHREYQGETDKVTHGTCYIFKQNGDVQIHRECFEPVYGLETASTRADVSSNYEPAPQFGQYENFMRKERQLRQT
ncbi:hypothetical protein [Comamonas sp. GB3 AK4-5]|uniref:hypothetical protein n=1 Tax=Comamonas sp. GB3 AK4-5 TaxID=3231487 RepID=UPI00351F668C